jgi:TDG/mug DNA glycosylase family protein
VVECTALEMRHARKGIEGSNPSFSAILSKPGHIFLRSVLAFSSGTNILPIRYNGIMSEIKPDKHLCAFPPIIGNNPHTLILGTMPGVRSLELQKYYAHPQNQFWKFMGDIYGASPDLPYEERCTILIKQGIAVWDVLQSCVRPGSMDSDIKQAITNDFAVFFLEYPTIKKVVFDSAKAEEIFIKTQKNFSDIEFHRVPSPSPAHARMSYSEKLTRWTEALNS